MRHWFQRSLMHNKQQFTPEGDKSYLRESFATPTWYNFSINGNTLGKKLHPSNTLQNTQTNPCKEKNKFMVWYIYFSALFGLTSWKIKASIHIWLILIKKCLWLWKEFNSEVTTMLLLMKAPL